MEDGICINIINKRGIQGQNITMGDKIQVHQEGGFSANLFRGGNHKNNTNTTNKSTFNSNIAELEDSMFEHGRPSDAYKYEDSIKVLINYAQHEYSAGVYLRQAIGDGKVPDLALKKKPTNHDNKSDAKSDMDVFKWK